MIAQLMPSFPFILGNIFINISDLESGQAPFLLYLTRQTHRLVRVLLVHNKDSHSSTSTHEEFLQDIIIKNLPIEK